MNIYKLIFNIYIIIILNASFLRISKEQREKGGGGEKKRAQKYTLDSSPILITVDFYFLDLSASKGSNQ